MFRIVAILSLGLGSQLVAQSRTQTDTPLPATGLDFAAVEAFWPLVDQLEQDVEPTASQWSAVFSTPGYRLATIVLGDSTLRQDLELAFRPSNHAAFDSLTRLTNDRASRLTHLVRAASLRPQLEAFCDSLRRAAPIAESVRMAAAYLPPGATDRGDPPFVAFAIFRNDGYSLDPGVVVDLLNAYESNLVLFLGHEFHHTYVGRAQRAALGADGSTGRGTDWALGGAIQALRNEGIADLVDKPHPLTSPNPVRAAYVKRYNEEYAKTPATLRQLDSLLEVVADDSTQVSAAGLRARSLLWSNSHANGAYIARTIYERFGIDSLYPAITNPAAMLRTYTAAEAARGHAPPFSPKAWRVIEDFERRYWLPSR